MFVSRSRPRTLATLVRSSQASFNTSSSSRSASPASKPAEDSIFSTTESPWDHVFSDIPDVNSPSPLPSASQRPRSRLTALDRLSGSKSSSKTHEEREGQRQGQGQGQALLQRSSVIRKQRAAITAREMSVFDEMFDLIFNAVNAQDGKGKRSSSSSRPTPSTLSSSTTSFTGQAPSIGIGRASANAPLNDLFRTLRRHTSRVRWTTEIDEELDRKKETMELFNTDQELLQWAMKELFGESQQWDEEAKKAIAAAKGGAKDAGKTITTSASLYSTSSSTTPAPVEPTLNPSIYPHLIAYVMRIFRTTYTNPSLSLAIFNHAARVSIPSYVFGCTAPAYNELVEARWQGWGDLEGVCNTLEEMRANGVVSDGRTRIVVEKVRREVGAARPVELGGKLFGDDDLGGSSNEFGSSKEAKRKTELNPLARRVWTELGEAEVMKLLHQIEQLALRRRSRKASPYEELWKSAALKPDENDGWSFDNWDEDEEVMKQRQKQKPRQRRQSSSHHWPEQKRKALPSRDWSIAREEEMAFR